MRRSSDFEVVHDESNDKSLVIRDLDRGGMSVTNDAENVVECLAGELRGRRLFYYDSNGQLDELVVADGKFVGFAPGPKGGA